MKGKRVWDGYCLTWTYFFFFSPSVSYRLIKSMQKGPWGRFKPLYDMIHILCYGFDIANTSVRWKTYLHDFNNGSTSSVPEFLWFFELFQKRYMFHGCVFVDVFGCVCTSHLLSMIICASVSDLTYLAPSQKGETQLRCRLLHHESLESTEMWLTNFPKVTWIARPILCASGQRSAFERCLT